MDYKGINDYELIYRIRENDDMAVNTMLAKYEPIVISLAKKYYPKMKHLGVEMSDLIQEGRIAVVKAINSYDADGNTLFYTYVSLCIDRNFITYIRNLSREKNYALNYSISDEYIYTISDSTFDPVNYLVQICDEEKVRNVKNSFEFLDSNIFELRCNGFSYKEISELLDVSLGIVDSRLCKIRRTLQRRRDKF